MKNCSICKKVIDQQWADLQNEVSKNLTQEAPYLSKCFIERCIYCYKSSVELYNNKEQEWYQELLKYIHKKKQLTLLIDMDNVVANLSKKWIGEYNKLYKDNLDYRTIDDWNFGAKVKCSIKQYNDIINRPRFFADLEVVPHSIEVTKRLQDAGHKLYFVTATPFDNSTCGFDKFWWVEKYFPHIGKKNVIQTHCKFMIKGDLLFDDSPGNLDNFPGITVAYDYLYNKSVNPTYRVSSWQEFEQLIYKITK